MGEQVQTNDSFIPEPMQSTLYIAGFLKTQIGKLMQVEFLIGNSTTDRTGTLVDVGVSYILLRPINSNGVILCDLYSIKFVTIIERPAIPMFGVMPNM